MQSATKNAEQQEFKEERLSVPTKKYFFKEEIQSEGTNPQEEAQD